MSEIIYSKGDPAKPVEEKPALPMRSCTTCMFMQKQRISPTDLRQHMFCFRFPPTASTVPSPQGLSVNCMHPPVQASEWCFEYRPNSDTLAKNG